MIYEELRWRGLIHQTTDDQNLPRWLDQQSRTVYAGFDPTADSMHIGHLVPAMILRRFQKAGHRPIAVLGGATGMIGDPSGKSDERNLLSIDTLRANVSAIEKQMRNLLDFESGASPALLVNNFDWMSRFSYLEFLRDIGKNFPVNVMLSKDSVKNRLGSDSGLSFTEFSYMLLQAYDFVHLNEQYNCELQVGGSDQWGNITAGIDLGRRMRSVQLYGMTCPLLLKSDGTKMGKTEKGSLWLSPEKTSPYLFYQYWVNLDDADVGKCLRYFTDLSQAEVESLDQQRQTNAKARTSQKKLADEMTRLVHGESNLAKAQRATSALYSGQIEDLTRGELDEIFADVPHKELTSSRLSDGLGLLEALVLVGPAKSNSDARRLVQQGGVSINNDKVTDPMTKITASHVVKESYVFLRAGKKNFGLLRFMG